MKINNPILNHDIIFEYIKTNISWDYTKDNQFQTLFKKYEYPKKVITLKELELHFNRNQLIKFYNELRKIK